MWKVASLPSFQAMTEDMLWNFCPRFPETGEWVPENLLGSSPGLAAGSAKRPKQGAEETFLWRLPLLLCVVEWPGPRCHLCWLRATILSAVSVLLEEVIPWRLGGFFRTLDNCTWLPRAILGPDMPVLAELAFSESDCKGKVEGIFAFLSFPVKDVLLKVGYSLEYA